ncbi:MAG: GFA family protein [Phycicoccus sp.]|nr:GFA family protein [Phycicoccus sp.]
MSEGMAGRAEGRCLCGGIEVTITGPLRPVTNCHCHRCRRFTGHFLAATQAALDDVEIRDASGSLASFAVPGAAYQFCRTCGSSLFWQSDDTLDRLSIAAGILDPPTGLVTEATWFVSEASDYHVRQDVPEWETE